MATAKLDTKAQQQPRGRHQDTELPERHIRAVLGKNHVGQSGEDKSNRDQPYRKYTAQKNTSLINCTVRSRGPEVVILL